MSLMKGHEDDEKRLRPGMVQPAEDSSQRSDRCLQKPEEKVSDSVG